MEEKAGSRKAQDLLREIERLVEPRSPVDLIKDATGLFVPGFTAVPAVSIVRLRPARDSTTEEVFATGQLFSFEVEKGVADAGKPFLAFFTPIDNLRLPPTVFSDPLIRSRGVQEIQAESERGWTGVRFNLAWLPWDASHPPDAATAETLVAMACTENPLPGNLRVTMTDDDDEVPLSPRCGLRSWVPEPHAESMVFPINCARRLVAPLFFSVEIPRLASRSRLITLRFSFPEGILDSLYRKVGLGGSMAAGFSVIGNAMPIANVDLKAWEPDLSYADFARTSDMRPLGFAGVAEFKRKLDGESTSGDLNPDLTVSSPVSAQFSVGFDISGRIFSRYCLPNDATGKQDRQLLFWMTHGPGVNGMDFKYVETAAIQPMHKTAACLKEASTLVPCFGGQECLAGQHDLYESLLLNYDHQPQLLLYRDALLSAVRDLLMRLGYGDRAVTGPFCELRVGKGGRERVTVVYVRDNILKPIRRQHLAAIQDYLDERAPLGSNIVVEVHSERTR